MTAKSHVTCKLQLCSAMLSCKVPPRFSDEYMLNGTVYKRIPIAANASRSCRSSKNACPEQCCAGFDVLW